MNSLQKSIFLSFNPFLILLVFILLSVVFILSNKIFKRYKSTYVVYEKSTAVDNGRIKQFHEINTINLQQLEQSIADITANENSISFLNYIAIQEEFKKIIDDTLQYNYLQESCKNRLLTIQKKLIINFHNIPFDNLENYSQEINNLVKTMDKQKEILFKNNIFVETSLNQFFDDYLNFIEFCSKNSKNVIIKKLKNFNGVSSYELQSFENSFNKIIEKEARTNTNVFSMYNLILELFNEKNSDILQSVKAINHLQQKVTDQESKFDKIKSKISNLMDESSNLHEELLDLENKTVPNSFLKRSLKI